MRGREAVPVVLASRSPRRVAILRMLGVEPKFADPGDVERPYVAPADPARYAEAQASAKARAAAVVGAVGLVVAADTVVVLERRVLGKPADADEAREMLRALAGRTHTVITGIALAWQAAETSGSDATRVTFRSLRDDEIAGYLATGQPLDKAGAYGIQDRGAALIRGVEGCFFNVMGLPVARLLDLARELGLEYDAAAGAFGARRGCGRSGSR